MTDISNKTLLFFNTDLVRVCNFQKPIISDNAFWCYVSLLVEQIKAKTTKQIDFYCNTTLLALNMSIQDDIDKNTVSFIKKGFNELTAKTNIKFKQTQFNGHYLIKTDSLDYDKVIETDNQTYFVPVELSTIQRICKSNYPFKKRLLRYYCCLLSLVVGKNEQVSFVSLKTAADLSGYSETSCVKYNKVLQDLQLIAFYDKHLATGSEHYLGNVFATWDSRSAMENYVEQYYPKCKQVPKTDTNKRKSLVMKYYRMLNGKQYDRQTTKKIKEYIVNRNKYYTDIIDDVRSTEAQIKNAESKLLDESIFEKVGNPT